MKATKEYVTNKFLEYNELCFEGKLSLPEIKMVRTRKSLGHVKCMKRRKLNGTWEFYDFKFCISTVLDQPEEEVEDTIIHEMIHYYILSNQIQDTSAHGKVFRQIMKTINTKYGKHISISRKKTKEEYDQDLQIRQHIVCVAHLKNQNYGVMVTARTRLFLLWTTLENLPEVESFHWYITTDPFFNRFPRSLTLRLYKVAEEDIKEHLQGAVRLVKQGNVIRKCSSSLH
ncbi:MAG: SprT family zinc-dependent metalloprotease [Bacteroidales bacterium]|nr:SprT family zinc-dependent metalloprotease [Bacteroidales bacterium]